MGKGCRTGRVSVLQACYLCAVSHRGLFLVDGSRSQIDVIKGSTRRDAA